MHMKMNSTDKDVNALDALMQTGEKVNPEKLKNNIKNIKLEYSSNRKTSISFCMLGMWTIQMPPYGLARLIAITRAAGYNTKVYDYNVETYNNMKLDYPHMIDAWQVSNYWMWSKDKFYEKIFPYYKEYLDEYVEELLNNKTDIIGFSCYRSNILATNYVALKIKEISPETIIIYGGPECHEEYYKPEPFVDYYFVGETEQNILTFLEDFENGILPEQKKIGSLFGQIRINLDTLPYPDYSDFKLWSYSSIGSVTTELSRGCVARCTYCSEVYYWKYRDRKAIATVNEIEFLYKTYGVRYVLFADSLMNGNIKEFKNFVYELRDRNLMGLRWWGYLRADARMDDDLYKAIKQSGGGGFNYGFESGSNKVLEAINKKNTVDDINANIISGHKYGVKTSACWVIGAPGEDIEAWSHSLNLIWNHKNKIYALSSGIGLGDNAGTAYDDREKFNMNPRGQSWHGSWLTLDFKNTYVHRFLRAKMIHIWLNICNTKVHNDTPIKDVWLLGDMDNHYDVNFLETDQNDNVEYEYDFDYNIIQTDLGDFANSLMNEHFALLRLLWRAKGAYEININYNPNLDKIDFENMMSRADYNFITNINFKIDKSGKWEINSKFKFTDNQIKLYGDHSFEHECNLIGQW